MLLKLVCTDGSLENGPGILDLGKVYLVGRSSKSAFFVNDLSVSRQHAEVIATDISLTIKDLGSRNGTYIERLRIDSSQAWPGQMIFFGNAQFQVMAHEQPPAAEYEISELSTALLHMGPTNQPESLALLTKAERRVLDQLLIGLGEKEVAAKLVLSQYTVHDHIKAIYRKLEVNSRPELLALFVAESKKPDNP